MRSHSGIEIRRCRPLLGTLVEIACQGSPHDIDCAFAAIEKVHRLMSFHDPVSDVTRMNRHASRRPVKVHPWTWRVLKSAQEFSRKSDGIFDITMAPQLVKLDFLPRPDMRLCSVGSWRYIVLDDEYNVQFRRRMIVDLGGIAKGFAVDRAVRALKNNAVTSGIVNAGGDLANVWIAFGICLCAPSRRADRHCRSSAAVRACHGDIGKLFRASKISRQVCGPIT